MLLLTLNHTIRGFILLQIQLKRTERTLTL
nr:MAG TPA: hypothetical protein [Caudoviricetes sp.]